MVSTDRLNRLIEHEAGDLTCVVEAGIRLGELRDLLVPYRQILALDPPGDPTVGACVGGALSGPLRHRFGSMRDLLLGVTVVLADGVVASSGGKVVKNVAGYDLAKLFCGSRGTLGLVARAALRLHPAPDARAAVAIDVDEPATAARVTRRSLGSPLDPSAVDLLWPGRLLMLFEGSASAVEMQVNHAGREFGAMPVPLEAFAESRERQSVARGVVTFAPGALEQHLLVHEEAVVRVAAGVAYIPGPVAAAVNPGVELLTERIRREFDPAGVLAS